MARLRFCIHKEFGEQSPIPNAIYVQKPRLLVQDKKQQETDIIYCENLPQYEDTLPAAGMERFSKHLPFRQSYPNSLFHGW